MMGCCGGGGSMFGFGNTHQNRPQAQTPQDLQTPVRDSSQETPLELLKQRLAKGEINLDEYEKLAQVLSN